MKIVQKTQMDMMKKKKMMKMMKKNMKAKIDYIRNKIKLKFFYNIIIIIIIIYKMSFDIYPLNRVFIN